MSASDFGMDVRSIIVDNTPYFVGKDVDLALGYKDTSYSKKHVHEDDRLTRRFADSGQREFMELSMVLHHSKEISIMR